MYKEKKSRVCKETEGELDVHGEEESGVQGEELGV